MGPSLPGLQEGAWNSKIQDVSVELGIELACGRPRSRTGVHGHQPDVMAMKGTEKETKEIEPSSKVPNEALRFRQYASQCVGRGTKDIWMDGHTGQLFLICEWVSLAVGIQILAKELDQDDRLRLASRQDCLRRKDLGGGEGEGWKKDGGGKVREESRRENRRRRGHDVSTGGVIRTALNTVFRPRSMHDSPV